MKGFRLGMTTLLAVLLLVLCGVAAADADPIRVSSLSEPQSVISEQDVSITIKIYNSSQTDMQEEITLYDPQGISVEKYSGLKGEQSVTYTGKWHVTQDQIEKGKISYYIQYTVDTGSGPQKTTRTVPVTIQTEEAAPQLTATYSISPTSARKGQNVTLSYTLSNTGNVELRSIAVKNEGVSKKTVTQASLSVGEKVTLTDTIVMGSKEMVSKPTITYQAAGDKKTYTISDMAKKTITVAEDGLEVALSAKNAEDVYPGDKVELTISLKNTGSHAYTGLAAVLSDGTAAFDGVDLKAGGSYEKKIEWTAEKAATLSVTVSGSNNAGETVSVASNDVTVTTQDASRALVLNVYADAQQNTIYSEPAVVRFGVVVENVGETDAATLTIEQAGTTVAKIPSLPSGESRTVVFDAQTSIGGKFMFVVRGKDVDGNERKFESNVLEIAYIAPTPTPTAVPTPSPVPPTPTPVPTATPAPTLGELIAAKVNMTVLYGVAGVLAALLVAVLTASGISAAKRKKRMEQAIDTIELAPDVRNHKGSVRRRRPQGSKADTGKKKDEPVVQAEEPEKEEADPNAPARSAMRQLEREENRRRRAQAEVPTDETLRVAPVDQRPEFVAQGKVDDSRTRIFGGLAEEVTQAAAEKQDDHAQHVPAVNSVSDVMDAAPPRAEAGSPETGSPEETVRLSREQTDELRKAQEEPREDKYAGSGKKKDEIKPMKKKGLFGGLGKKKKAEQEEDDFFEDDDGDLDDDDLIE